jgi:hypothetical protein
MLPVGHPVGERSDRGASRREASGCLAKRPFTAFRVTNAPWLPCRKKGRNRLAVSEIFDGAKIALLIRRVPHGKNEFFLFSEREIK